jgi:hypothetical protein
VSGKAVGDGAESLRLEGLRTMMRDLAPYVELRKGTRYRGYGGGAMGSMAQLAGCRLLPNH